MDENASPRPAIEDVSVTAIIPYCETYTPREMLSDAVESVHAQERVDTEVIVVEDEDERGPAWARNVGLDRAETRYVGFLDADDEWHPTKLRDQLERMRATGAGLCVDGETPYSRLEFVRAILTSETFGLTSSILLDRDRIDARFDESLQRREDHLFMIEAAMEDGVCFTPETFVNGTHDEGFSQYVDTSPEQVEEFFERVVERVPEAAQFRRDYYRVAYVYLGRRQQMNGAYDAAVRHYLRSLRWGPSVDAVGGLGLTFLAATYDYSLRPLRGFLAGGTRD
jgi:glycosyltransferase involved in cell wall biosynthesis